MIKAKREKERIAKNQQMITQFKKQIMGIMDDCYLIMSINNTISPERKGQDDKEKKSQSLTYLSRRNKTMRMTGFKSRLIKKSLTHKRRLRINSINYKIIMSRRKSRFLKNTLKRRTIQAETTILIEGIPKAKNETR